MDLSYYTYAYLREDGTPYYIGKGSKNRIFKKKNGEVQPPKGNSRIMYLKQNLSEEDAFKHEKYMISIFGRKDLGTGILRNKTDGGEGTSGFKHSNKTLIKLKEQKIGKNLSLEHRKKISKSLLKIKDQLSRSKKGKSLSFEHKEKIRQSLQNMSAETRKKMSNSKKGANNPMYGKKHSKKTIEKIKEKRKDQFFTEATKLKMSKSNKGKNNPMYGKKHSKETIEKIRKTKLQKKQHDDF